MAGSPDILHPLKAYAVVFEAAIGIPHDPKIQQLLVTHRIPSKRWLLDLAPLPTEQALSNPDRAQSLVEEFDRGFADIFSHKRPRRSVDPVRYLKTLSYVYGLEDGQIHPMEELAQEWGRSRNQVNYYRTDGLHLVLGYLERRHRIKTSFSTDRETIDLVTALRESLLR